MSLSASNGNLDGSKMMGGGLCKRAEASGVTKMDAGGAEFAGAFAPTAAPCGELRKLAMTRNPSTARSAPPTDSTITRCFLGSDESSGRTERRVRETGLPVPTSIWLKSSRIGGLLKRELASGEARFGVE